MSVTKQELLELVDSVPDTEIAAVIEGLSELGDEEVIHAQAAAQPDGPLAKPGDKIPSKEPRQVD